MANENKITPQWLLLPAFCMLLTEAMDAFLSRRAQQESTTVGDFLNLCLADVDNCNSDDFYKIVSRYNEQIASIGGVKFFWFLMLFVIMLFYAAKNYQLHTSISSRNVVAPTTQQDTLHVSLLEAANPPADNTVTQPIDTVPVSLAKFAAQTLPPAIPSTWFLMVLLENVYSIYTTFGFSANDLSGAGLANYTQENFPISSNQTITQLTQIADNSQEYANQYNNFFIATCVMLALSTMLTLALNAKTLAAKATSLHYWKKATTPSDMTQAQPANVLELNSTAPEIGDNDDEGDEIVFEDTNNVNNKPRH